MPGPLHGFRSTDLTGMASGPLATMLLADQGADVIKVEPPLGDHTRRVSNRRGGPGEPARLSAGRARAAHDLEQRA